MEKSIGREICRSVSLNLLYCNFVRLTFRFRFETVGSAFTKSHPEWRNGAGSVLEIFQQWADGASTALIELPVIAICILILQKTRKGKIIPKHLT
jgi:hypothetical protein